MAEKSAVTIFVFFVYQILWCLPDFFLSSNRITYMYIPWCSSETVTLRNPLKGVWHGIFDFRFFCTNQCPPGRWVFRWVCFKFFWKFAEIFSGRVSTEVCRHGIPRNFLTSEVISAQFRRNSAKFRGIPRNFAGIAPEITSVFRGMPKCHFRGHPIQRCRCQGVWDDYECTFSWRFQWHYRWLCLWPPKSDTAANSFTEPPRTDASIDTSHILIRDPLKPPNYFKPKRRYLRPPKSDMVAEVEHGRRCRKWPPKSDTAADSFIRTAMKWRVHRHPTHPVHRCRCHRQ